MEDAYLQLIEFCGDSDVVIHHYNFEICYIKRICKDYDLPMFKNNIIDLDTMFRLKFNRGYSTRFAENHMNIASDEEDDWRHLDIAGKAFGALQN